MATTSSLNLVQLVETLIEQQQQHADAMAAFSRTLEEQQSEQQAASEAIADTLATISELLSALLGSSTGASRPRPMAATNKGSAKPAAARNEGAKSEKRGKKSSASGPESVLAYVEQSKNPTSAELAEHWKSEGRGGKVDRTLGMLVKSKKLKRTAIEGGRGSRYSLA